MTPLRVTPLTVCTDLEPAAAFYSALGFERIDSGDPACIGFRSGATGVMLAHRDHVAACYGDTLADRMVGATIPYIHVHSIEAVPVPPGTRVSTDVTTGCGTRERVFTTADGWAILAETVR